MKIIILVWSGSGTESVACVCITFACVRRFKERKRLLLEIDLFERKILLFERKRLNLVRF